MTNERSKLSQICYGNIGVVVVTTDWTNFLLYLNHTKVTRAPNDMARGVQALNRNLTPRVIIAMTAAKLLKLRLAEPVVFL